MIRIKFALRFFINFFLGFGALDSEKRDCISSAGMIVVRFEDYLRTVPKHWPFFVILMLKNLIGCNLLKKARTVPRCVFI
jgi:hypothetical protein